MDENKKVDTANEPVDHAADEAGDFMDTGILHEPKPKPASEDEQ